jgi:monofunctional biosynthetic peptidoglycan transglycosylase
VYLNIAEMGEGIYGVEAAAQAYYGKSATNLSRKEAAQIAACLPNPVKYKVKPVSKYVAARSRWVLRQMNNLESDADLQEVIN